MSNQSQNIEIDCRSLSKIHFNKFPVTFNAAHIEVFFLDHSELIPSIPIFESILSEEEIIHAHKYFRPEDRHRSILSRGTLKWLIGNFFNQIPRDVKICLGKNKKPIIQDIANFEFNMSHTAGYSIIAMASNEIGIDIEKITPDFQFQDIIASTFHPEEIAMLEQNNNSRIEFYKYWTRKEALIKATAKGIDDDLINLSTTDGIHQIDSKIIESDKHWKILSFKIKDDYIASLAYQNIENPTIKFINIDNNLFLK